MIEGTCCFTVSNSPNAGFMITVFPLVSNYISKIMQQSQFTVTIEKKRVRPTFTVTK